MIPHGCNCSCNENGTKNSKDHCLLEKNPTYRKDLWEISGNVNNCFELFSTHSFQMLDSRKVILSSWKLDENWLKIHFSNALHFFVHLFLAKLKVIHPELYKKDAYTQAYSIDCVRFCFFLPQKLYLYRNFNFCISFAQETMKKLFWKGGYFFKIAEIFSSSLTAQIYPSTKSYKIHLIFIVLGIYIL